MFKSGFAVRVMTANPCLSFTVFLFEPLSDRITGLVLGVSLVGGIGTMMGTMYTSPENTVQKHLLWGVCLLFNE